MGFVTAGNSFFWGHDFELNSQNKTAELGVPRVKTTLGNSHFWDTRLRHSCTLLIGNPHSAISLTDIVNQPTLTADTGHRLFSYPVTANTHLITLKNFSVNSDSRLSTLC